MNKENSDVKMMSRCGLQSPGDLQNGHTGSKVKDILLSI